VKLTTHPDLVPKLSVSGAAPLLLPYAFTPRTVTDNTDGSVQYVQPALPITN